MIDRFFDLIFIDSFALAINLTFGTLLGTKICNYSWEGVVNSELSTPESSASYSESPPSLEADFSRDVEKKEWFAIIYRDPLAILYYIWRFLRLNLLNPV